MPSHPLELALAERINACTTCRWLGVEAKSGEVQGVLVLQREHATGVWSYHQGDLVFRTLARWDVVHRIADVDGAYAATVAMAEENRWTP